MSIPTIQPAFHGHLRGVLLRTGSSFLKVKQETGPKTCSFPFGANGPNFQGRAVGLGRVLSFLLAR